MAPPAKKAPETPAESQPHEERASAVLVEVPEGWASVQFDNAYALREQYQAIIKARKANREGLRNLQAQGLLSKEEEEELEELYPERTVTRKDKSDTQPAAA